MPDFPARGGAWSVKTADQLSRFTLHAASCPRIQSGLRTGGENSLGVGKGNPFHVVKHLQAFAQGIQSAEDRRFGGLGDGPRPAEAATGSLRFDLVVGCNQTSTLSGRTGKGVGSQQREKIVQVDLPCARPSASEQQFGSTGFAQRSRFVLVERIAQQGCGISRISFREQLHRTRARYQEQADVQVRWGVDRDLQRRSPSRKRQGNRAGCATDRWSSRREPPGCSVLDKRSTRWSGGDPGVGAAGGGALEVTGFCGGRGLPASQTASGVTSSTSNSTERRATRRGQRGGLANAVNAARNSSTWR